MSIYQLDYQLSANYRVAPTLACQALGAGAVLFPCTPALQTLGRPADLLQVL